MAKFLDYDGLKRYHQKTKVTVNGKGGSAIALTPADLGAVDKTGDTMSGALYVEMSTPRIGVTAESGKKIDIRVAGNGNRGLYDEEKSGWILSKTGDGDAVRVHGSADTLTTPRKINGVDFDGSKDITINVTDDTKLSKTGNGEIEGTLYSKMSTPRIGVTSTAGKSIDMRITGAGDGGLYDAAAGSWILRKTSAGVVNLMGNADTATKLSKAPKEALADLGIFYADKLPATGTDGQICLVPVS